MRNAVRAVALVGCLVVLAACAREVPGRGVAATSAPEGLEGFYSQVLSWGPCVPLARSAEERDAFADPAYDCAYLTVPIDYAVPDDGTARVALLRQRASGTRIGSLLVNPGGPGVSGIRSVAVDIGPTTRGSKLGQFFDVVGFDPRGVGASVPAIDCIDDAEWEVERADLDLDTSPAGIAQTEEENRVYAQRCAERSGGDRVLANVGTRDVVRDLDVLRAVLGDDQLSYIGFSYGTLIGALYAERFPQNVRAMVLDGAVDPTETTEQSSQAQYDGFQQALAAYAGDCATSPACPLGTDPSRASEALEDRLAPLIAAPVPAEGGTRVLTYSDAEIGADAALYSSARWPDLTAGLDELAAGDGTTLLHLADAYYGRLPEGGYDNETEAFYAIRCVDDERVDDRAEVPSDVPLDLCAFWPVPPTSSPHMPRAENLAPTLTISTTGDPATPYEAGVALSEALKGSLLSVDGEQHTAALSGSTCVDDVVATYLVELRVPPTGTRCVL